MTIASTETPPQASTAADFRRASRWFFQVGEGLVIECRHLSLDDLLYSGEVPLPVLQHFASLGGVSLSVVIESPHNYRELIQAARQYAALAAVAPRVVLDPTDDPEVLVAGQPELPDSVVVRLMNEGVARRLGVKRLPVGLFRGTEPQPRHDAPPDGGAVSDAAELLADAVAPGGAGSDGSRAGPAQP